MSGGWLRNSITFGRLHIALVPNEVVLSSGPTFGTVGEARSSQTSNDPPEPAAQPQPSLDRARRLFDSYGQSSAACNKSSLVMAFSGYAATPTEKVTFSRALSL